MKKIIALILCIQILNIPAFAEELIIDSFAEKTLVGKTFPAENYKPQEIEDILINSIPTDKKQIQAIDESPIVDTFAEKNIPACKYTLLKTQQEPIQDEFAVKTLKTAQTIPQAKPEKIITYNFDSIDRTPVKISINSDITTKNGLKEGQELQFKVLNEVKLNNQIIKKDSTVIARLETISLNQAFGVPADIVVENFRIKQENKPDLLLDGSIKKTGANRSLWVYPVGYIGIMFFFAGLLVLPIRGGHAKIKTKDVYEVYYVPSV